MKAAVVVLALVGVIASDEALAVTLVSDPTDRLDITHCAYYLNASPRALSPVAKDSTGKPYCNIVITVPDGSHSISAAFAIEGVNTVPREGPKSAVVPFVQPAAVVGAPTGLKFKP